MNIFVLNENPIIAARQHCDKHVVKMILESAQMLSTAHRILDGKEDKRLSKSGKRMVPYWELSDEREHKLYKAVHMKHPCTIWSMESNENYHWHWRLFNALCDEYIYRYKKVHKTDYLLRGALLQEPKNIPQGPMTPFKLAMFEDCKGPDPVDSYRTYYHRKEFKMVWTGREFPKWYGQPQYVA